MWLDDKFVLDEKQTHWEIKDELWRSGLIKSGIQSGQEKGSSFTTRSRSHSINSHVTLFLIWPHSHISTLIIKKLCPWNHYATHSRITQAWSEWWGSCATVSRKTLPVDIYWGVFGTLCSTKVKSSVTSPYYWHRKSKEIYPEWGQIVGNERRCEGHRGNLCHKVIRVKTKKSSLGESDKSTVLHHISAQNQNI